MGETSPAARRNGNGIPFATGPRGSVPYVATYEDQISGAKAQRPALDRALADARLGRFDVLLVYRVDRFARSLKVLVGLLEDLDSAGVAFRSATEPIDTSTATGRMLVQLLGVFAEFERATIIDRVINGMERKPPAAAGPEARCLMAWPSTTRVTCARPRAWPW